MSEYQPPGLLNMPDISDQATYNAKPMQGPVQGFIFHHSGGGGTPSGVVNTLNERGLGVQYVMDRSGKIYQTLPDGSQGAHFLPSKINGLNNSNSAGMEIIAKNNDDVTPAQVASAKQFADQYSAVHPGVQFFGHGEVNPGHKEADEGMAAVNAIRQGGPGPPIQTPTDVANAGGDVTGASLPSTAPASNLAASGGMTQPMPQGNTGQAPGGLFGNTGGGGLAALGKQLMTAAQNQKPQGLPFPVQMAPISNTQPLRALPLNLPKFGQQGTGGAA